MKTIVLAIIGKYLQLYPDESERQRMLIDFLDSHDDNGIKDWNNFEGHIVAGGFIYAKNERAFLVLYHNDLKMYLYPGGHTDGDDNNPLEAAKREILEETGLINLSQLILGDDELIPIDIDTHMIEYNERLNLPEHYHFDFRYLFIVEKIVDIKIDTEELSDYQWVDISELSTDVNYGKVVAKIERIFLEKQV